MRELTSAETEHAAGGIAIMGGIAIGIGTSLAATYIYEKAGGAAGIDRMAKAAWNAILKGLEARASLCQKAPVGCMPVGF